jgi:xanthine dehydrogenase YagT iron-sulfur-binding subunit
MDKRPLVLANLDRWSATGDQNDAIRAQLRGLGAHLLIVSESGTTLLGPDDEPRQLAHVGSRPRPFGLEVSGVDADGNTRWSQHLAQLTQPPAEALLQALRDAVETMRNDRPQGASRRELLIASLVTALALAFAGCGTLRGATVEQAAPGPAGTVQVELKVNGAAHKLALEPRVTLLDALRERLGLFGAKKGCDQGQCGACTVLVDGVRVDACLALAVQHEGREIVTIEGLEQNGRLHPLQAAFIEHDALQCGYCTPGQILSAIGLMNETPDDVSLDDAQLREGLAGNLCRCGAYSNIIAAVRAAQQRV